jgi:tetratricopeptide (TPR) repeat protein
MKSNMYVCLTTDGRSQEGFEPYRSWSSQGLSFFGMMLGLMLIVFPALGQDPLPEWQTQVRKYAEVQDWPSAMSIVDREVARAPQDMDVRAWRARVLTWSGRLAEAEKEYLEILKVSRTDPDNWAGLASVYLREAKTAEALGASASAVELDPKRADLHVARARVLRAAGERNEARQEFQKALNLDPGNGEARAGLNSLRDDPKHELYFGQDNDLFNFTSANHDEWTSLVSRWTPRLASAFAENTYQRGGAEAGKFVGSVTLRQPKWGAVTLGGAVGHDNGVIPKREAFFELDHGWKTGKTNFVRGVEFDYGQHWYWYQTARILTLNGTASVYFPRDWMLSLAATGARNAFSGTGAEWRPSGLGRLAFPLAHWSGQKLSGSVFFAVGTEDFALIDQIGRFASQTFGGGLKLQMTARQDITGYAGYQKRTQGRTDTSFGLSYGIHF